MLNILATNSGYGIKADGKNPLHHIGYLCPKPQLWRYRQFYQTYPQIWETVSPELHQRLLGPLVTGNIEKPIVFQPFSRTTKSSNHFSTLVDCR